MRKIKMEFVYRRHGVLHRQFPFGFDLSITETEMAFEKRKFFAFARRMENELTQHRTHTRPGSFGSHEMNQQSGKRSGRRVRCCEWI